MEVSDFYDIVVRIDSFRNLKKKKHGDYGWDLLYSKDFDYSKRTKEKLAKIGVVGNRNSGKSFILSKLTNMNVPSGFNIKTEGISIKYPDMKSKNGQGTVIIDSTRFEIPFLIIDSAGFETPLLESFDFKLDNLSKLDVKETMTKMNDLVNDRALIEVFILKYVLDYSDIIIAVVGQLTYSEQQLLLRIKRENPKKKIIIVHNLLFLDTKKQVTDYINNVLKQSFTFNIEESNMISLDKNNKVDDTVSNQTYYVEYIVDYYTQRIDHLIMAREGTEAGNYYNQSAIQFLSNTINTTSKLKKFPVKALIKNYLYSMSSDVFTTSIPKPKKGEKGVIIDGEVTIDNVKKNKIYIDGYNKDLVLKPWANNIRDLELHFFSRKLLSFLDIYQPNYCLYITDNIEKLPIKKNGDELQIYTDKPYYILVLIVEIPGELEDPNIIPRVDIQTDFIIFKIEGSRKINKKNNENKHKGYYSSFKDGFFSLDIKIKPDILMLSSPPFPFFRYYENGILTYYYQMYDQREEDEEIDFD